MYYFDWSYMVLVLPCMIFAMWASANVNSTYKKYAKVISKSGYTANDVVRRILDENGLYNVRIEHIGGNLTDHYDPKTNVIRLSDSVYDASSVAAIGVAAHEAGHAVQYAQSYGPIKLRAAIIPVTNIGSKLAMPLILLGVLFGVAGEYNYTLVYIGIACFALSLVFQLVTLPVEFNASRRAMQAIEQADILTQEERRGARKTLTAAAMTYVAATAVALAQILRLLILFGGGNRRRND